MEVFPSVEDLRIWADRLEEVQDRLAPYFERAEPRHRAMASIRGEVERDLPRELQGDVYQISHHQFPRDQAGALLLCQRGGVESRERRQAAAPAVAERLS